MMKKAVLSFGVLIAVLASVAPAGAQTTEFSIEITGVARGAEGEVLELVNRPVDANLVGATCSVNGRTENNESTHPNNDLIIATGDTVAEVPNVEAEEFQTIAGTGTLVLGESIVVSIRFGPNGVTSGGTFLDFSCTAAAPAPGPDTGAGGTADTSDQTPWVAIAVVTVALSGGALLLAQRRGTTTD
jgi:hypothetical protein